MNNDIKVVKRDNSKEPFSTEKLKRVAIATGISEKDADKIIQKIKKWASKEKTVKSDEIRERFSNELRKVRAYSADLYDWYQKVKLENQELAYEFRTA